MKIMAFDRCGDAAPAVPPRFTLFPDSSLVVGGNPVFVPGFSDKWSATIALAFRVCRLGKCIAPKFAARYRDAVTAAVRIVPTDLKSELEGSGAASGLLGSFDNALTLGTWIPIPDDGRLTLGFEGTEHTFTLDSCAIDSTIALLSNYLTLKMGDVVMPVSLPLPTPVEPGASVAATINGEPVCTTRFK